MNRLPVFLLLAALLFGLLPYSGDAREIGCFGRDGFACYCCTKSGTSDAKEAFSPCPCPGPDNSLSNTSDLLMAQNAMEINLPTTGRFYSSTPVPRNYFGTTPQKPPPFL